METIIYKWHKNAGCSENQLKLLEVELKTDLPLQYKDFLLWSNGGEGKLGKNYIYIWTIEDIIQYNKDYEIHKYLQKEYLAFGMDGDVGYVFYLPDQSIYKVDFGDLDINSNIFIASSFSEFLGKAFYMNFNNL